MTSQTTDHGYMSDAYAEALRLVLGDGAEELISKANPDGADLSAGEKKRRRRQAQIGYASNVVGLAAGVGGTAAALRDDRFAEGGKWAKKLHGKMKKLPKPISGKGGKAGAAIAAGALGLQVGNIAGDAVANRVLSRAKKKDYVHKSRSALIAVGAAGAGGGAGYMAGYEERKKKGRFQKIPRSKKDVYLVAGNAAEKKIRDTTMVEKMDQLVEISKIDEDKRQVFGWASVVEKNGQPVVDLQGDYIPVEEMEKAAYNYVRKSRKAGDMHRRDGENPFVVGEMIESFALTPEKKQAMGLPEDMPSAWWVGFQYEDDQHWADIKSGKRTGFSVHGTGRRSPVA